MAFVLKFYYLSTIFCQQQHMFAGRRHLMYPHAHRTRVSAHIARGIRMMASFQRLQKGIHLSSPSTYKFERQNFRHGRRNEPKFGTHVRIDNLTLKKLKKLTHPTPGGFRGLLDVRLFVRATAVLAAKRAERHDRPRTTTHDRPRLPYLFEEAVPTPPQGGLGG